MAVLTRQLSERDHQTFTELERWRYPSLDFIAAQLSISYEAAKSYFRRLAKNDQARTFATPYGVVCALGPKAIALGFGTRSAHQRPGVTALRKCLATCEVLTELGTRRLTAKETKTRYPWLSRAEQTSHYIYADCTGFMHVEIVCHGDPAAIARKVFARYQRLRKNPDFASLDYRVVFVAWNRRLLGAIHRHVDAKPWPPELKGRAYHGVISTSLARAVQ